MPKGSPGTQDEARWLIKQLPALLEQDDEYKPVAQQLHHFAEKVLGTRAVV